MQQLMGIYRWAGMRLLLGNELETATKRVDFRPCVAICVYGADAAARVDVMQKDRV